MEDASPTGQRITDEEFSLIAAGLSAKFIDGLCEAAIALGIGPAQASRITVQTISGSVALARNSGKPLAQLIAEVASPGGTTEAGLAVLRNEDAIGRIVAAAFARR